MVLQFDVSDDPIVLRQQAAELRDLAASIDALPVLLLARALDERAWIGPSASRCRQEVQDAARRTANAADDLRFHAERLLAQAEMIENNPLGVSPT